MKNARYRIYRKARRVLLCCIFVMLVAFFYKHYDETEYSADNEQEYIDRVCKIAGVPALSVAVWENENEVFLNYYNGDNKVDENSLYELASTSKAFTGLAILQLQYNGLISFDSPVEQYIPEFHPTYRGTEVQITIEQLLNHTSGIPSYALDWIPEESFHAGGLSNSLSCLYDVKLLYEPGSKHEYSTVNYDLLALIVERITGIGFENFVKINILDKVVMDNSFYRTDLIQSDVVQGYKPAFFLACPFNAPVYYGNTAAGYLISDTYDLMKWLKNVKNLFDFDSFPISSENQYFAGWNIYDGYVCHGGNNPNYSSQVYVDRNEPLGVFVLSAKAGSSASTIGDALFRIHHGEKIKIGMYIDFFEILDLLFVTIPLIVLYAILWIPYDSKDKVVIRFIIGLVIILAFAVFLLVSPISYRYCFVWFPGSLVFFVGFMVSISIYLITRSIVCFIKR